MLPYRVSKDVVGVDICVKAVLEAVRTLNPMQCRSSAHLGVSTSVVEVCEGLIL